jgi:HlyD family secretion protein
MSFSMFVGRVLIPSCGLAIGGLLVWEAVRSGRVDLSSFSISSAKTDGSSGPPVLGDSAPRTAADSVKIVSEGRVVAYPGAQVVVGSSIAGTIDEIRVHEKSVVHKGDVLVEFKSKDIAAQVAEASARLSEADSDVDRIELEESRLESLVKQKAAPRQEQERLSFSLRSLKARRDATRASRDRLEALLEKYRIVAPIDGVVTSRFAQPGETVSLSAPLVTIVDLSRLRIEAEVDEYDIAKVAVGSLVKITAEGYPGQSWHGEVEELSDVLVGRRIRPEDPGRPTDTRVLPVRIALRVSNPLRFGQRVEVEIRGRFDKREPAASDLHAAFESESRGPS